MSNSKEESFIFLVILARKFFHPACIGSWNRSAPPGRENTAFSIPCYTLCGQRNARFPPSKVFRWNTAYCSIMPLRSLESRLSRCQRHINMAQTYRPPNRNSIFPASAAIPAFSPATATPPLSVLLFQHEIPFAS